MGRKKEEKKPKFESLLCGRVKLLVNSACRHEVRRYRNECFFSAGNPEK
uniref:Uncharacterized protein n=1 Tax=Anguilla anguilla TaxID=7936 RepID=A0A0E9R6L9_ANGAN